MIRTKIIYFIKFRFLHILSGRNNTCQHRLNAEYCLVFLSPKVHGLQDKTHLDGATKILTHQSLKNQMKSKSQQITIKLLQEVVQQAAPKIVDNKKDIINIPLEMKKHLAEKRREGSR